MADITKCTNSGCSVKDKCYRWTAIEDEFWQAVSLFQFRISDGKITCDHFWANCDDKDLMKIFDGRGYKI